MAKSVTFAANPRSKPDPADLDAFVQGRVGEGARPDPAPSPPAPAASEPKVPMKRLTFDIDAQLHRRMRISCVERGVDMAVEIRELLAERYPPRS